jgi:hypothetical protein
MPDVSIYVAAITGAAGVLGAAVPLIVTVSREARKAERDRQERRADAKRQACIELLRAAGNLRTQVANTVHSHGEEILAGLARIRGCAEAVALHAVNVGLLAEEKLSGPAQQVAAAADRLAVTAAANTDTRVMAITPEPDCAEFDESVAAFRQVVIATADE